MMEIIGLISFMVFIFLCIKLNSYLLRKYNCSPISLFNILIMVNSFLITSFLIYYSQK